MTDDAWIVPNIEEYYMGIAFAVRRKANCHGYKVGAIVVKNNRIISTGYNGTPEGMTNCLDGGCYRCANRGKKFKSGTGYDLCICVHAEQNALLAAARFGISLEDAVVYTTLQPCFGCMKEMLQTRIKQVFYGAPWPVDDDSKRAEYDKLSNRFPDGMKRAKADRPDVVDDQAWTAEVVGPTDEHGHQRVIQRKRK